MHREYILLNGFGKAKKGFTAGFHVPLSHRSEQGDTYKKHTTFSPWARQNIGTTQGGKTSMVQIYLLYQYKLRKMW